MDLLQFCWTALFHLHLHDLNIAELHTENQNIFKQAVHVADFMNKKSCWLFFFFQHSNCYSVTSSPRPIAAEPSPFCHPGGEGILFHCTPTKTSASTCLLALRAVLMNSTGFSKIFTNTLK